MIHIVLHEPRIPQNTGNIARLCVALGARLHLIHPLGFALYDKGVKRAGMDYLRDLEFCEWDDFHAFCAANRLDSANLKTHESANLSRILLQLKCESV